MIKFKKKGQMVGYSTHFREILKIIIISKSHIYTLLNFIHWKAQSQQIILKSVTL